MDDLVNIDMNAIGLTGGIRPKVGAVKQADGSFAPDDLEIVVLCSVGASKQNGLLGTNGKRQGQMVMVGGFTRALPEWMAEARVMLGGSEIAAQVKRDGET